jgi:hypothetical protein
MLALCQRFLVYTAVFNKQSACAKVQQIACKIAQAVQLECGAGTCTAQVP